MGGNTISKNKITWAEAPWWRKIVGGIIFVITVLTLGGLAAGFVLDELYQGHQVCTVESAKFNSSSGGNKGPSAYRSIHVETSDCGTIVITDTRYPYDMNDAALLEFLQNNKGKKFEFVTKFVQFPDALSSFGISSTEPVE